MLVSLADNQFFIFILPLLTKVYLKSLVFCSF